MLIEIVLSLALHSAADINYKPIPVLWYCKDPKSVVEIMNEPISTTPLVFMKKTTDGKCAAAGFGGLFLFVPEDDGVALDSKMEKSVPYTLVRGRIWPSTEPVYVWVAAIPKTIRKTTEKEPEPSRPPVRTQEA